MVVRLLKDTSWKEMIHSLLDIVLYGIEGEMIVRVVQLLVVLCSWRQWINREGGDNITISIVQLDRRD